MSKYSDEFKLEVVQYCLEEHHGFIETAKHFNIPSEIRNEMLTSNFKKHIINYEKVRKSTAFCNGCAAVYERN